MDVYQPHLLLMQETKTHKLEEQAIDNKLGSERKFFLNSDDQYETDFGNKLSFESDKESE